MIAEIERVFTQSDRSLVKVVARVATTVRGLGAQVEYTHSYFVSVDGKFWSNIPEDAAAYFVTEEQRNIVNYALWAVLEPVSKPVGPPNTRLNGDSL